MRGVEGGKRGAFGGISLIPRDSFLLLPGRILSRFGFFYHLLLKSCAPRNSIERRGQVLPWLSRGAVREGGTERTEPLTEDVSTMHRAHSRYTRVTRRGRTRSPCVTSAAARFRGRARVRKISRRRISPPWRTEGGGRREGAVFRERMQLEAHLCERR